MESEEPVITVDEPAMKPLAELEFDQALADAPGLVLVDFWAAWCGPCKVVGPILERLAPDYADQAVFYKVDADQNRRLMQAFGVRSLPTVLLLRPHEDRPGAAVVGQVVGAHPSRTYVEMIERGLNPKPSLIRRIGRLFGGE